MSKRPDHPDFDPLADKPHEFPETTPDPEPQIYSLSKTTGGYSLSRRSFIKSLGAAAVAGTALVTAADSAEATKKKPKAVGQVEVDDCGKLRAYPRSVALVKFSPAGDLLVSCALREVKIWSLPEGKMVGKFMLHDSLKSMFFLPDGAHLLVDSQRSFTIWSLKDKKQIKEVKKPSNARSSRNMKLSPDRKFVSAASLFGDGIISCWSAADWKLQKAVKVEKKINDYAFHPSCKYLVAAGRRGLDFVSFPAGEHLTSAGEADYKKVFFSPDGKLLYAWTSDGSMQVWQMPPTEQLTDMGWWERGKRYFLNIMGSPAQLSQFSKKENYTNLILSPDGKWFAGVKRLALSMVGSENDSPVIELHKAAKKSKTEPMMQAIAFSEDSSLLASGHRNGSIKLWQVPDGKPNWCLFDPAATESGTKTQTYKTGSGASARSFTLPCGSPKPAGAVCTCDCVSVGGYSRRRSRSGTRRRTVTRHYWRPN